MTGAGPWRVRSNQSYFAARAELCDAVETKAAVDKRIIDAVKESRRTGMSWGELGRILGLPPGTVLRKYPDTESPGRKDE